MAINEIPTGPEAGPLPTRMGFRVVPVVDLDGRPLSPCSPERAEENIAQGLARWREDGALWLRYRPLAYRQVFRRVIRRDGYRCAWCGGFGSTLDHVIPVSWGGQATMKNCVVACRACNHTRNNLWPSRFAERLGVSPTHPVITAVLAREAELFDAADRAILRRPVESCRSKEEAQVWAAFHLGVPERINRKPPEEWSTRLRPAGLHPFLLQ
jgi:hypothetical protein